MRVSRKVVRLLAGSAFLIASMVTFGLTAPAAANPDPDSGTIDTSVTTLDRSQVETLGDECSGDKCKQIPWCPPPGKPPVGITEDSPVVVLGDTKGEPECVKKPKITYEKCCINGKGDITVTATNLSPFKMRIKVWLDNGTPVVKWVNGNSSAEYKFEGAGNGWHTIHSAVLAGNVWCEFVTKRVYVKCEAPPSPTQSPLPSLSPSPSQSAGPGDQLPQTGAPVGGIAAGGLGLLGAGAGALLLARRRRNPTIE